MPLELSLELPQGLYLVEKRLHPGNLVRVDQMILENGKPLRAGDLIVRPVLTAKELVHLGGGELVGVATVDSYHHRVPGLHEKGRPVHQVTGQDLLRHGHGAFPGLDSGQPDFADLHSSGKREQTTVDHHEPAHRVESVLEFRERHPVPGLETSQDLMISHENALIHVVSSVNRRERRGYGDADPTPLLRLDSGLPGAPHTLPVP